MSTLQAIDLNGNKLTGTISENIVNLPALSVLQIEDNLFEGALPVALSTLEELRKFFVVCLFSKC
jgi:Leucine rich repeat